MQEQWKELKETIIEMRDNDGTYTQHEACKFLVNLMEVLEEQVNSSEESNKWISVEDRLPDKRGEYLVYSTEDDGEILIMDFSTYSNHFYIEDEDNGEYVVAWMPLPKYEAKEE